MTGFALRISHVEVTPLAIPMRLRFEHAAASRAVADPIVVQLRAAPPSDAQVGWGETLARDYVSGETCASVLDDIRTVFEPLLLGAQFDSFEAAALFCWQLPYFSGARLILAARAAVELALLDLAGRVFQRRAAAAAQVVFSEPARPVDRFAAARYSGIVVGSRPAKMRWMLRAQYAYGLRDFKLKVAIPGWQERLAAAHATLRRSLDARTATLRVDANGGWTLPEALAALPLLERCGVCAIEQPLATRDDELLPQLCRASHMQIIADESLRTLDEGRLLLERGVQILNVRIAKNGGLLPSVALARLARERGAAVQLGCLVGETSILSAAGLAFLEATARLRFVEGAFGRWLLRGDVVKTPVQFGYRGRVRTRAGFGLGIEIDPTLVTRHARRMP